MQFEHTKIQELSARFRYDKKELERNIMETIKPAVAERGFLRFDEFKDICEWKTERSKSRVDKNKAAEVEEISRISLSCETERLRIGALCLLEGVSFPTASVILHFLHPDPYPILDFRALESLGVKKTGGYSFDFWLQYVEATRKLAKENQVDMRTLDRALWQWSSQKSAMK